MTNTVVNPLDALLAADLEINKDVFIKRLQANFTIKAIDGEALKKMQEMATFITGKGKNAKKTVDEEKLGKLIISEACVSPNFADSRLLEKYGASDGADVVQKALLAGEIAKLSAEIMDISGFGDEDEQIEEVKN